MCVYLYVCVFVFVGDCKLIFVHLILYIANCSRWKSFADGQASSNSLENFHGFPTPLIFKRKCHKQLHTKVRRQVSPQESF